MERSQRMLFLLGVCLIAVVVAVAIASHRSSKRQASKEMQLGIQVLKAPDQVVKELVEE